MTCPLQYIKDNALEFAIEDEELLIGYENLVGVGNLRLSGDIVGGSAISVLDSIIYKLDSLNFSLPEIEHKNHTNIDIIKKFQFLNTCLFFRVQLDKFVEISKKLYTPDKIGKKIQLDYYLNFNQDCFDNIVNFEVFNEFLSFEAVGEEVRNLSDLSSDFHYSFWFPSLLDSSILEILQKLNSILVKTEVDG